MSIFVLNQNAKDMMNESVQTIMTPNPIFVYHDSSALEVFDIILKKNIHSLPVLKGEELVGIVSSYDLAGLLAKHEVIETLQAKDIMNSRFLKLSPEDKIGTAAELLLDRRFKALPVVSYGRLVGIVTSYDVLRYEFKREYRTPILYKDVLEMNLRAAM